MKLLVPDEETARWLATRPQFMWDDGNSEKSEDKHGVSCAEAESLLGNAFVLAGRIVKPVYPEARWMLFGKTRTGKLLTMAFTRRGLTCVRSAVVRWDAKRGSCMQKSSVTRKKAATPKKTRMVRNPRDKALAEDWADVAEASGAPIVVYPLKPTSIKLEPDLIALLAQKGKKRGLPYQTMLKVIVRENIDRY